MYYYYVRVAKKFICPQETISLRNTFCHKIHITNMNIVFMVFTFQKRRVFLDETHTIEKVHYNVKIILKLLIEV